MAAGGSRPRARDRPGGGTGDWAARGRAASRPRAGPARLGGSGGRPGLVLALDGERAGRKVGGWNRFRSRMEDRFNQGVGMFITGKSLPRRTFLKGVGAAVALPFLDSMVPAFAAPGKPPVRLAFLYVPNGIDMKNWNVPQEGPLAGNLPRIMKPLEAFCGDMIQIGN